MYFAGCYNPLGSTIEGKTEWNESIVNLPHGLSLSFRIGGGRWFSIDEVEVLHYEQVLELSAGLMRRTAHVRDDAGRITTIEEERFVSMDAPNLVGQRITITPHNWSGPVLLRSEIDGSITDSNLEKHADYAHKHLQVLGKRIEGEALFLFAKTINSNYHVAVGTRDITSLPTTGAQTVETDEIISRVYLLQAEASKRLTIDKLMAVCVGASEQAALEVVNALEQAGGFDRELERHRSAWQKLWRAMPFTAADNEIEQAQHLTLFHLLQNFSPLTLGRDVALPARGSQEVYRGQVFWDEMFCVPLLSIRFPELARELLLYRHTRLEAARENARSYGLKGALYPWRSARTGKEETPRFQKSPINGHWREDHTAHQVHVNASIAWDIFHYVWATGDRSFLDEQGMEILVAVCRMWASLAVFDPEADRFDIAGVVGPDEFHTHYAQRAEPGIDNNAYTNVMAAWTLSEVLKTLGSVPQAARNRLQVSDAETQLWDHISRRVRIPFTPDGLISQFDGVERLKALDPDSLGNQSADWELEAQGEDIIEYQVFKQADFAMLLYLFRPEQLQALFGRLGYAVTAEQLHQSVEYYRTRTSHGSSLSQISYSGALSYFDLPLSYTIWREALAPDLDPAHRESTAQGLHLGSMAAALDVLQRHYLGLVISAEGLELVPRIPIGLPSVQMTFCYKDGSYELFWDGTALQLRSDSSNSDSVRVATHETRLDLAPGELATVGHLPQAGSSRPGDPAQDNTSPPKARLHTR
jgi:trehalose/maltose hydrolase-like predicted phosphorylase